MTLPIKANTCDISQKVEIHDFEHMPPYHFFWGRNYCSGFSYGFKFRKLEISFEQFPGKKFERAAFVISRLPNSLVTCEKSPVFTFFIDNYYDLYTYHKAISCLDFLLYKQRSARIFINGKPADSTHFRDMMWLLDQRLLHCPFRSELPIINEVNLPQEYWDKFHKPLVEL